MPYTLHRPFHNEYVAVELRIFGGSCWNTDNSPLSERLPEADCFGIYRMYLSSTDVPGVGWLPRVHSSSRAVDCGFLRV